MSSSRAVIIASLELLGGNSMIGTSFKASFRMGSTASSNLDFVSSGGKIRLQGPIALLGLKDDCQFEVVVKSKNLMMEKVVGVAVFSTNNVNTTATIESTTSQLQMTGSVVSGANIPSPTILTMPSFFPATARNPTSQPVASSHSPSSSTPVSSAQSLFDLSPTIPRFNVLIITIGRGENIPCVEGTGESKSSDAFVKIK